TATLFSRLVRFSIGRCAIIRCSRQTILALDLLQTNPVAEIAREQSSHIALDFAFRNCASGLAESFVAFAQGVSYHAPRMTPFIYGLFQDPRVRMLRDETSSQ